MSPDPERTAERSAVVSFTPWTAACLRCSSHGPDRQLIQVSLLASLLTDALCPPGLELSGAALGLPDGRPVSLHAATYLTVGN